MEVQRHRILFNRGDKRGIVRIAILRLEHDRDCRITAEIRWRSDRHVGQAGVARAQIRRVDRDGLADSSDRRAVETETNGKPGNLEPPEFAAVDVRCRIAIAVGIADRQDRIQVEAAAFVDGVVIRQRVGVGCGVAVVQCQIDGVGHRQNAHSHRRGR